MGKRRKSSRDATQSWGTPFGARLRRLRETAGLTQEELADRSGLTAKAVGALERGERKRPYPHTVRSLADALGLDEDERNSFVAMVQRERGETSPDPPNGSASPVAATTASASSPTMSSALPSPLTPLLGREREAEQVADVLRRREARLLTLTGPGGVGKTRLALEVASDLSGGFPDGAVFVALAPLGDAGLVMPTVARALGLRETGGQPALEAVVAYLRGRELLLVLDNFEHVIDAAPDVAELLGSCPGLSLLATSRAPLRVRWEQEYPVSPLGVPNTVSDLEEVSGSPAVQLFVERVGAVQPAFELTRTNAAAVAEICHRLEGLPLALELAAAQTRFLDPAALLSRLDRALSSGGAARDLPERQRTMRSTLDWSYELLSEKEKALFRRLGVFAGGFALEAAEAVGASFGTVDPEEVLDLLGCLVEQSLVTVAIPSDEDMPRYDTLEPIRQYALEKLEEADEGEAIYRAHATFFLDLAEQAYPELRGPRQVDWIERLDLENGNLRAAISWSLSEGLAPQVAARLGWALWQFWWVRGYMNEGRRWMEETLKHALPPALRARAANVGGVMAYAQGDYEASEEFCKESLDSALQASDALLEGYSWIGLGLTALSSGDFESAGSYLEKALPLFDRTREEHQSSMTRVSLGTVFLVQGDADRATPMFEEGLAIARRVGDRFSSFIALYNLAQVGFARGDHDGAATWLEQGITLSEEVRDQANLAYFSEALAVVAGERGELERSARLFGAAEGLFEAVGAPVYSFYQPDRSFYERMEASMRSALGEPTFERARNEGREMSFEEAVAYALEEKPGAVGYDAEG